MLFDLFKKITFKTLCFINMMDDTPTHLNTNLTNLSFFENWVAETEACFFFVSKPLITATDSPPSPPSLPPSVHLFTVCGQSVRAGAWRGCSYVREPGHGVCLCIVFFVLKKRK